MGPRVRARAPLLVSALVSEAPDSRSVADETNEFVEGHPSLAGHVSEGADWYLPGV